MIQVTTSKSYLTISKLILFSAVALFLFFSRNIQSNAEENHAYSYTLNYSHMRDKNSRFDDKYTFSSNEKFCFCLDSNDRLNFVSLYDTDISVSFYSKLTYLDGSNEPFISTSENIVHASSSPVYFYSYREEEMAMTVPLFPDVVSALNYLESGDDSEQLNKETGPIDVEGITSDISSISTYDETLGVLEGLQHIYNGRSNSMSSYSGSSSIKWITRFDNNNYYVQVRTTFRYKMNGSKIWETFTMDTSVPTGRGSTLVDDGNFTINYGEYASYFWRQDTNYFTNDDLDKSGNIQIVRDSIRIVKIDGSNIYCGPWLTFDLDNGIWETGKVDTVFESTDITPDNDTDNNPIIDKNDTSDDIIGNFDWSDIGNIWETFLGIFKSLFSFIGNFPSLFAKIFSFLPYEIRNIIYATIVSVCIIGIIKAVIT